jgi:hypothetical protein
MEDVEEAARLLRLRRKARLQAALGELEHRYRRQEAQGLEQEAARKKHRIKRLRGTPA